MSEMTIFKVCLVLVCVTTLGTCSPTLKPEFWKGTPFDSSIEHMRSLCAEDDPIACLKFKAITFLDSILQKDIFQISENVEISRNDKITRASSSRSDDSVEDSVEDYLKTHDATFKLPILGSTVSLGARNLDNDEIDLKLNLNSGVEGRGKSKIKKILTPILVFVLLKAITLVPLALGILGLKAWNALQLSFFSFILAVGLAVFQLCKKIASDNSPPQIAAHAPWEPALANHYAARSFDIGTNSDAQYMAYKGYAGF